MAKLIAAINMTVDGYCDHTVIIPDEEIHQHYTDLLNSAGTILYGRKTYELMKFWQPFITQPSGDPSHDEFAIAIDKISKIVFSHTLINVGWDTALLATRSLKAEVESLKQKEDKDILVGSPSLIVALTNMELIDEFQLCVHPVIAGKGLPLFKEISEKLILRLLKTKPFSGGVINLYYQPLKKA